MVGTTEKDPNEGLADDAALATDLGDEDARKSEQLAYYGGDDDDIEIPADADRGDDPEAKTKAEDEADGEDEPEEDDSGEEEVSGKGEDDAPEVGDGGEEAEDEAEDEAADDGDQDDSEGAVEGESAAKNKGIPRHRFNEVNQRMRDAEAELAALRAEKAAGEQAAEEKFDFDAAEEAYMSFLLDGKTKDAAAQRRIIREAEKAEFKAEAKTETLADVDTSRVADTVNKLSKEAEAMFPAFDPKTDEFNPRAVSKTLTYMKAYQLEGMTADDAFVSALADVIELFGLATEEPGDEAPEPKAKGKTVTKKAPIKKTKEKLAAQRQQGRSPAGEGEASADRGAATPDINDLSDDEIDALPADTLARLRGDFM